jgi:hypothetical protein
MDDKNKIDDVIEHLKIYIEARWKLFILNASDKASDIISSATAIFLISFSFIFVLIFLSIAAAIWIGNLIGNSVQGFLYVALFYLLVTIVLFLFRKSFIKMPVLIKLLNAFYSDEKD